ncbi:indolepyruvate oxidoreductase subunit beta family protein [Arhodomonas sp. SL1]|uniref:indolepyruvate oxidoreductase subunit beta family protein n=1 Tax=Arhodomonas sp. SL1 TaxID=3425691 RepID=UPI003F883DF6
MDRSTRPISIAIQAMGGQGGGVLADWIVGLAESQGYLAQTTSVPGVAQRTGATLYYVEIFPEHAVRQAGRDPVLALMPMPGDVDIVIAAELMEAGRAVQRGIVTPDRTTLIASTHRVYAIGEKTAMGDGILDDSKVVEAGEAAAKEFIYFDMARVAEEHGSVISATLFGALAGCRRLPFERAAFEEAIRRGGIGVEASLAAFADAYERAQGEPEAPDHSQPAPAEPQPRHPLLKEQLERVRTRFPGVAHFNVVEGMRRLADYQDPEYAKEYVDRLEAVLELDEAQGGEARDYLLTVEAARYLALWMSYEDTIRVADLKTRASRFRRFRDEVRAREDQLVYVTEFMHPRIEEICDTLPAPLGRRLLHSPRLQRPLTPFTRKGRKVRTATLSGFLLLWTVSRMRRWRRSTLRYKEEAARIEAWLERARRAAEADYPLAVEIVRCQRLVKGYGDTHARGLANFHTIMEAIDGYRGDEQPAEVVRRLREAALADEDGAKLAEAVASLEGGHATTGGNGADETGAQRATA